MWYSACCVSCSSDLKHPLPQQADLFLWSIGQWMGSETLSKNLDFVFFSDLEQHSSSSCWFHIPSKNTPLRPQEPGILIFGLVAPDAEAIAINFQSDLGHLQYGTSFSCYWDHIQLQERGRGKLFIPLPHHTFSSSSWGSAHSGWGFGCGSSI